MRASARVPRATFGIEKNRIIARGSPFYEGRERRRRHGSIPELAVESISPAKRSGRVDHHRAREVITRIHLEDWRRERRHERRARSVRPCAVANLAQDIRAPALDRAAGG